MLGAIFERFVEESPISVMVRGLMERSLAPEKINQIFEANAQTQYTRELLFSRLVDLMSLVVCGIYPSVNAAYRAKAQQLNVSRTAVYDKLNGVEPEVSAAIVRETAASMASLIEFIGGASPQLLAPYRVRVIDGNCLEGTDHRLKVLRTIGAVALPGKSIVILDPELRLAINVFPCEDGHAQERSLFNQVLDTVARGELYYMADEIQGTYRGMMIAIPPENWSVFASFDEQQMASVLLDLASRVSLSSFLKQPRAPKKKKDPPTCDPRHRHVSTARLLALAKKSP